MRHESRQGNGGGNRGHVQGVGRAAERIAPDPGQRLKLDFTLADAVSIAGQVVALDPQRTPLGAVQVEAVRQGSPAVSVLSNGKGEFQFINLPPGEYRVRCLTSRGPIEPASGKLQVSPGRPARGVQLACPQFKKGHWRHYNSFDGLAHDSEFLRGARAGWQGSCLARKAASRCSTGIPLKPCPAPKINYQ